MTYEPIKTILERIRQFHRRLRRQVEEARRTSTDPRSEHLLTFIRRSEQDMDGALKQYEGEAEAGILETWIQYVPSETVQAALDSATPPPDATPEEILLWKLKFDQALAAFYRQLAGQVAAPRAQELLESLAALIDQQLANQSWRTLDADLAPAEDK